MSKPKKKGAGCDFNPRWFWTQTNIENVLKLLPGLQKPIFHICSGVSNIGDVRLDRSFIVLPLNGKYPIQYQGSCHLKGDMCNIPFKSGVAGSVICDPPYRYKFNDKTLIQELVRICKPTGNILFIAPWIPRTDVLRVKYYDLWKCGNNPYYKIASISQKVQSQIEDYL